MDFYGFYTGKIFDAYRFLGAQVTAAGVVFRTFAPSASKISVIGTGLESNPGVVSEIFAALAGEKINIEMITTSEIKISLIIERRDTDRAVKALHKRLVEDGK